MLCCVCLLEKPNNMGVFDEIGHELKIAEIIEKYLWFKPESNNILTNEICSNCWHKLDDFHKFYQTVEKAHQEYDQNNAIASIKVEILCPSPIKLEQDYKEEEEGKEEESITNLDNNLGIEESDQTKNPLEENDQNFFDEIIDDEEGETSNDYEPSISSQQQSSMDERDSEYDKDDKQHDDSNTKRKVRSKRRANLEKCNDTSKKKRTVQRLDPIHTEEMIKKHIPMGCNLCVFVGTTFADIVQHFRNVHPKVRPYIMCCDKKFSKRFFVAQHALKHENPNCFRCEECNKSFTTVCGLRNHNVSYHASKEELIYACDKCPKKFARRNLLELHKPSHIPKEEWKYVCNICPNKKTFASTFLLNVHTSMKHKREVNICPVCAKEIRDKKSYEKHVRLHYEDSGPRVKCPYPDCDSWLKDEDNLKQHLTRHNPEGIIYKCDECTKECKNRRALTNHKRYAHSNKIFQCDQCDKTFKKSISLREHLTQHTGETLYKCPFCTRTFNSNANMHAHKKKQHPVEWEEWRKNKRGSAQKIINNKNPLNQFDETLTELNQSLHLL